MQQHQRRQESNLSKKMMHRTDASLLTALYYTDRHTVRERETEIWNNMLFHSNRSLPVRCSALRSVKLRSFEMTTTWILLTMHTS